MDEEETRFNLVVVRCTIHGDVNLDHATRSSEAARRSSDGALGSVWSRRPPLAVFDLV